jgi:uncharacterized protein (TIGR03067 family)
LVDRGEGQTMSFWVDESGHKFKKTLAICCCFLGVVAFTAVSQSAAGQSAAAQSFEGSWVVEEAETEMRPSQELQGASVVFNADNSFSILRLQRTPWRGTYSVDPELGTVDLTFMGRNLTPPSDGTVWEGMYRFNADGSLDIITAQGADARPVEFMTGYDLTLMTLRLTN